MTHWALRRCSVLLRLAMPSAGRVKQLVAAPQCTPFSHVKGCKCQKNFFDAWKKQATAVRRGSGGAEI